MQFEWNPASWQHKNCAQAIPYPSLTEVQQYINQLSNLPDLVSHVEIAQLKTQLALAVQGRAFIVQGGECAERFNTLGNTNHVVMMLQLLSRISESLQLALQKPIVCVGRIAGQYAKPRSHEYEVQEGIRLPAYRGDIINAIPFTSEARTPNPALMLQAYQQARQTLNTIQAFKSHNFLNGFYTSHEALLLPYEQALTRRESEQWFNLSTHYPWLGMRTSQNDGAHVEYLRGIQNPIAIKCGPQLSATELLGLIKKLDPHGIPGRITLIHRLGYEKITEVLPRFINIVQQHQCPVLWICDPMHGNTKFTKTGVKIRYMNEIMMEFNQALAIHQRLGSCLGGIHLEFTTEMIQECFENFDDFVAQQCQHDYPVIDPRLNAEQALKITAEFANLMTQ